jgi:hypothetical protein
MPNERKTDRYALKRDQTGWTVYEIWSGEPAVLGSAPQTGLSEEDAQHTLKLLNRRARSGDSSMRRK